MGPLSPRGALRMSAPLTLSSMLALCDACPARGGVTTEDEMYILTGSYFIPEPSALALGGTAIATLALRRKQSAPQRPKHTTSPPA